MSVCESTYTGREEVQETETFLWKYKCAYWKAW